MEKSPLMPFSYPYLLGIPFIMNISFIIPAHNEEEYLSASLRSVMEEMNGKPHKTEIIVVDNASTDRTRDIARSFPGVTVVDEPKLGLSRARQTGFLASSGEMIVQLDADTILPKGWVEKALDEFGRDPDLAALSCGPVVFYELSGTLNTVVRAYYFFVYAAYLANRFVFRTGSYLQGANSIIRRTALEQIGGYNVAFDFYGEDTDLARRLHAVGTVKYTLKFPVRTSGRRLKKEGTLKMGARYVINYFWALLFKKPFTKIVGKVSQK